MQTKHLYRAVFTAVLAAFTFSHSATAADSHSGNMWVTSVAQAPHGGFWIQVNDTAHTGKTIVSGPAPVFESVNAPGTIVAVPGKMGYWVVTKRGDVVSRGDAPAFCEGHLSKCSNYPSDPGNKSFVMHAAATPDGLGLWVLGYDGQVWTVGTAQPYGDRQGENNIYGSAIVPTPSGKGYYILMSDGGVHTRGDAVFFGSTGGQYGREYTGMVLSKTAAGVVNGYWLLEEDGGVHSFGDATFLGSTGGNQSRVTSMFSMDGGIRYGWVTYNGTIGYSTSYRRGPVSTTDHDLSMVWTLQGDVDKPGAEVHAAMLGSGRVDSWIFWPAKWGGLPVYQLRHEFNGLCLEANGDRLVQAVCQANFNNSGSQAFLASSGGDDNMYVSPAQNGYLAIVIKPGKSLLEISMSGSTQWRTLATTTVTSEATGAQWHTSGAVGDKTHLGVPDLKTAPQRWVVATTAPVPDSTVRFVSMATGRCGEFKWTGTFYHLFNAVCQMAVQPQTFQLIPEGANVYRISIAFHSQIAAAPGLTGGVMFTEWGRQWVLEPLKLQ